jgi:glutathione reductase (NADPH)
MTNTYDLIVIGGGSGGIACAKRSASYSKSVLCIERARLGGTCVNVGCVPKKVMWSAASIADMVKHDMKHYGFEGGDGIKLDFGLLKKRRDGYVKRLNGIYENGFKSAGVEHVFGDATFVDKNTVEVTDTDGVKTKFTGEKIVIATGGR